jgi:glutamine synthetase
VWSFDNRTAGYRLCGAGGKGVRVECRVGGADLNPYLAFTALLAAGLDGIERKLELEPAFSGDAYDTRRQLREIPKTLRDALVLLDKSSFLRQAMGDDVIEHYLHTGRWEQLEYDRRITDWEIKRGFERS